MIDFKICHSCTVINSSIDLGIGSPTGRFYALSYTDNEGSPLQNEGSPLQNEDSSPLQIDGDLYTDLYKARILCIL